MTSIEDILRAVDPMAGETYRHADLDAMILRITTPPAPARDPVLAVFKARIVAAVAAAGAVTALGIALLTGAAASLPALSFASSALAPGAHSSNTTTGMFMIPAMNYHFTVATPLPSGLPAASTYLLSPSPDPSATLAKVATALSLDLGAPSTPDQGQTYTSAGPNYSAWLSPNQGYSVWGVSSGAGPDSATQTTDQASIVAKAVSYAGALSTLPVGDPSVTSLSSAPVTSPATQTSTPPDPTSAGLEVTVPVLVNGYPSSINYDFTFAPDGTLRSASGYDFSMSAATSYPLLSPTDAVSQISSQIGLEPGPINYAPVPSTWASTGIAFPPVTTPSPAGIPSSTTTPEPPSSATTLPTGTSSVTGGSTLPSPVPLPVTTIAGTTTPTSITPTSITPTSITPTTLPVTEVTITGYTMQYEAYQMQDGSVLLLPVYVYAANVGDSGYQESFRVIAIDPSYLDFASATVHP